MSIPSAGLGTYSGWPSPGVLTGMFTHLVRPLSAGAPDSGMPETLGGLRGLQTRRHNRGTNRMCLLDTVWGLS